MFCLIAGIIVSIIIVVMIAFLIYNNDNKINESFYPYPLGMRHTKNMSYDIRGDVPLGNISYTGPWLQSDIYNYDMGYNWVRDNGSPLYF